MSERNERMHGFTLMEAVVALAVFAIGMLGLAGAFSQVVKANAVSRQKQISALLAERQMARLQMVGAGGLMSTSGTFEAPEGYAWQTQFSPRPEDPEVIDVWIEVTHVSGAGARLWSQMVVTDGQ